MATKVFISWSGKLSKALAEALRDWLPAALQYVKPYFSPEDIEKGTRWHSEIARELSTCNIGIICLTRDNLDRPWLLFEAGALSKSLEESRVFPLLFEIDNADVKGPLAMLQGTRFEREDFKRLFGSINNVAGEAKLDDKVLDSVFDKWWPELESEVTAILSSRKLDDAPVRRSDRDILEEVLELCRVNTTQANRLESTALATAIAAMTSTWFVGQKKSGQSPHQSMSDPSSDAFADSHVFRRAGGIMRRNMLAHPELFGLGSDELGGGSHHGSESEAQGEEADPHEKE